MAIALVLNIDASEKRAKLIREYENQTDEKSVRIVWKGKYMSLQKLENYSNKAVVQEEVLILTELLEDINKKYAGARNLWKDYPVEGIIN